MGVIESEVGSVPANDDLLREYFHSRDVKVRAAIISRYLHLAESVARRYFPRGRGEPLEDLVQVGIVGLIKAVDRFDPSKEAQFATYATHQIVGEIRHYLRDKADLIKHPRWLSFLTYQVNNESEKLAQKLGRHPTPGEIADSLNITEEGVLEILRLNETLSSMSLDEDRMDWSFESVQRKIRSQRMVSFQLPIEDKIVLMNAMERLVVLEKKAIYLFFYHDLTQGEIGEQLGVSQRTVSRVIAKGLGRLKEMLSS